jgi:hypothetical protein
MRIHQTIDENRKALRRIAALLSALADLAELAAGRPGALCLIVLWLIRPGEAAARDYVNKIAPGAAWLPEPLRPATGPAETLRLARSLRLLAATLAALADDGLAAWQGQPENRPSAALLAPPVMRPAFAAAVARLDSS